MIKVIRWSGERERESVSFLSLRESGFVRV